MVFASVRNASEIGNQLAYPPHCCPNVPTVPGLYQRVALLDVRDVGMVLERQKTFLENINPHQ